MSESYVGKEKVVYDQMSAKVTNAEHYSTCNNLYQVTN